MPTDTKPQIDAAAWAWPAPQGPREPDEVLAALAWWATGGIALLAWTGVALLLTGA